MSSNMEMLFDIFVPICVLYVRRDLEKKQNGGGIEC